MPLGQYTGFYIPIDTKKFTFFVVCYIQFSEAQRDARSQIFSLIYISQVIVMSDYTIENRETVVNTLTSRVIENAPLRELIRVYSEAVQAAIGQLSDDDVIRSISAAGYTDILEAFNLEVPPAEETPVSESEVVG